MDVNLENRDYKGHAIALYSGGLDSSLSILLIMRQGIKVTALTFSHDFSCVDSERSNPGVDPIEVGKKYGFDVIHLRLGAEFIDIVRSPVHGYGKNLNPCVDCRIMMLNRAKEYMEKLGADFIITGEVLGQRPMSQMRSSINLVEKMAGLKGLLVRPLSAGLMDETIPEKNGLLDRSELESISGRSRKRQLELAAEFGLEEFGSPAGGCLLTDVNYCRRLKDLFDHSDVFDKPAVSLLRYGRHFRFDDKTKVIVGRHESDNINLDKYAQADYVKLEVPDAGSPTTLLIGNADRANLEKAAELTARYSNEKYKAEVRVICTEAGTGKILAELVVTPQKHRDNLI
ncbi:MAG: hypothetical protein CVT49_01760 [candidate division Zixibacteria bacterium HGW-Zixibacteria-1]|nr:MAG: hypothetical protein CVT49_01760 [candidate division Zixibacteria bacterium HGW-Zixibacteria-1]